MKKKRKINEKSMKLQLTYLSKIIYNSYYGKGVQQMIKTDSLTRNQAMGIGKIYLDDPFIKNRDIIIGNKLIQARKCDNLRILCVYKDLFLKTYDEDFVISITNQNEFNSKIKDQHYASSWYLTNGIAVPFNSNDGRLNTINVQDLVDFDFEVNKLSYKEAIKFLKRLNTEIEKRVNANLRYHFGESYSEAKSGIIQFHKDNTEEVLDVVNKEVNESISLILK